MSNPTPNLWRSKLYTWTHDPAEKALVLLRDPTGHEGGTVKALRQAMGFSDAEAAHYKDSQKLGDHWASAADRPQFPQSDQDGRYAKWTQVRFAEQPELIHPLNGQKTDLGKLNDISPEQIKSLSGRHFAELIDADDRLGFLKFWRFGPETPKNSELGALWHLLPADTRVPTHTIWQHLDLTSAIASAQYLDPEGGPTLLSLSLGPVQSFIAQSRSTSDLWAGSHLLSQMAWEAMRVVVEKLGPDSIVFPQLRGVPAVDLWLSEQSADIKRRLKDSAVFTKGTDQNPIFRAALPNRFLAIVPANQAQALAEAVETGVREWLLTQGQQLLAQLLEEIGEDSRDKSLHPCWSQLKEQLKALPEVQWASVEWAKLVPKSGKSGINIEPLRELLAHFCEGDIPHLDTAAFQNLIKAVEIDGHRLYKPNPGVAYPALYDAVERILACAKTVRPFEQIADEGYRCSLTAERAWLRLKDDSHRHAPNNQKNSLWARVAEKRKSLIKKGEHLSAVGMIKRFWPWFFTQELKHRYGIKCSRYVVSTHAMAMAGQLMSLPEKKGFDGLADKIRRSDCDTTALPARLAAELRAQHSESVQYTLTRFPEYLDQLDSGNKRSALRSQFELDSYYAFILMDGDKMGAWLSGDEEYSLVLKETWHSQIQNKLSSREIGCSAEQLKSLEAYLESPALGPARHMAISQALSDFSLHLAPYVTEHLFNGKILYAGGDDLMAMAPVQDLLPLMANLRCVYSGQSLKPLLDAHELSASSLKLAEQKLSMKHGYAKREKDARIYRLMGEDATASMGVVIAHHSMPLGRVLRELRSAESRAKNTGGRNAFAIDLLKRSGGSVHVTAPWWLKDQHTTPFIRTLMHCVQGLGPDKGFSRRFAYLCADWLRQFPDVDTESSKKTASDLAQIKDMVRGNMRQQAKQQMSGQSSALQNVIIDELLMLCDQVIDIAHQQKPTDPRPHDALIEVLSLVEFLARPVRKEGN